MREACGQRKTWDFNSIGRECVWLVGIVAVAVSCLDFLSSLRALTSIAALPWHALPDCEVSYPLCLFLLLGIIPKPLAVAYQESEMHSLLHPAKPTSQTNKNNLRTGGRLQWTNMSVDCDPPQASMIHPNHGRSHLWFSVMICLPGYSCGYLQVPYRRTLQTLTLKLQPHFQCFLIYLPSFSQDSVIIFPSVLHMCVESWTTLSRVPVHWPPLRPIPKASVVNLCIAERCCGSRYVCSGNVCSPLPNRLFYHRV